MKTTNPSLIKKYFRGELEVWDCSKSFIIEPQYSLVFNDKVPYRKKLVKVLIAWRSRDGIFHQHPIHKGHPAYDLLEGKIPADVSTLTNQHSHLTRAFMLLVNLAQAHKHLEQSTADKLVSQISEYYEVLEDPEKLWDKMNKKMTLCGPLWRDELGVDITDLPNEILAEIMRRKIDGSY